MFKLEMLIPPSPGASARQAGHEALRTGSG